MYEKRRFILLLHTRDIPQHQRWTLPKSKMLKNIFHANGPKKQAGVTILMSTKIGFKQ